MEVPAARFVFYLAEQQRAAVPHRGVELPELVARICHGVGLLIGAAAQQELNARWGTQPVDVQPKLGGQCLVHDDYLRLGLFLAAAWADHPRQAASESMGKLERNLHSYDSSSPRTRMWMEPPTQMFAPSSAMCTRPSRPNWLPWRAV